MVRAESILRTIYVHDIDNPPYTGHSMHVQLSLTSGNQFSISNLVFAHQTSFTLTIKDPKTIGLTNLSDYEIEKFFDKVILAFNLVMRSAAFSRNRSDSSPSVIKLEPIPESKSTVFKDADGNTQLQFNETLVVRDSVHITGMFNELVDELNVLDILRKLIKLDGLSGHTGIQIQDLKKSIDEYAHACSAFDRLPIFKSLFSSLEHAVNCDGHDRVGSELDDEIRQFSGCNMTDCIDWREFNNRSKHIDRNAQDETKYQYGLTKVPGWITPLREVCEKVLHQRLQYV